MSDAVLPGDVVEGFYLGSTQRRLWEHGRTGEAIVAELEFEGCDASEIDAAVRTVLSSHELLRSKLATLAGLRTPLVRVEPTLTLTEPPLQLVDREIPAAMVAVAVAPSSDGRHAVRLELDPLVADFESIDIIVSDLASRLSGLTPAQASDGRLEFLDYSDWLDDQSEKPDARGSPRTFDQRAAQAFNQRFATADPHATGFESCPVILTSAPPTDELTAMMLDAWAGVLGTYTQSDEVWISIRVDGRPFPELATTVGPLAGFVPVSVGMGRPIGELRELVQHARLTPCVDVDDTASMFGLSVVTGARRRTVVGDVVVEVRSRSRVPPRAAIQLSVHRDRDDVVCQVDVDRSSFDGVLAHLLGESVSRLLGDRNAGVIGPRQHTRLEEAERGDAIGEPAAPTLVGLLERATKEHGRHDALRVAGRVSTFTELALSVSTLADRLVCHGVGRGTVVGAMTGRDHDPLTAVFGILAAGGVYLPLDPDHPTARLEWMLADAGAKALVVDRSLAERGRTLELAGPIVEVDQVDERRGHQLVGGLACPVVVTGDDPAYMIYTSGSTGVPKGVTIRHRSAANLHAALAGGPLAGLPDHSIVGLNAPLGFDASIKQLVQVLSGHCVVPIPGEVRRDPARLVAFLVAERIGLVDCTPSHLRLLLDAGLELAIRESLTVLVGGEAIDAELWGRLARSARIRYVNVYGPSETAVNATSTPVEGVEPHIGRPIGGAIVRVLDPDGRRVPFGAIGELHIGGAGVGLGYTDPSQTAASFVPDPYGDAGAVLYRTGDLGWWRSGGTIGFAGRRDGQVKVGGIRMELAEIEAVLAAHPAVDAAAAIVDRSLGPEGRLAAFVVARSHGASPPIDAASLAGVNQNETRYLVEEIVEKRTYVRNGVMIPPHAIVFDVGANIGVFTLFAVHEARGVLVHCFEPIPDIRDRLERNIAGLVDRVRLHPFGLSDRERVEPFAYYPGYSMMSSQLAYSDPEAERKVIDAYLRNEAEAGSTDSALLHEHVDELIAGRFETTLVDCELRRLSAVIDAEGVDRIDLLKIDVQRAELDVLDGIEERHWPLIDQVVLEVHDAPGTETSGRIDVLIDLLEERGFEVAVEQDPLLQGTDRFNAYAVRPHLAGRAVLDADVRPLTTQLREHLAATLPDYMVPATIDLIERMPLTDRGKVDRAALASIRHVPDEREVVDAGNSLERRLLDLWRRALGADRVRGVTDNFFEVGGDSIRSIRLQALGREHGIEIPLDALYRHQTIRAIVSSGAIVAAANVEPVVPFALVRDEDRDALDPDVADAYPLTALQGGMIFHTELTGDARTYHNATASRVESRFDGAVLARAVDDVCRRHPLLRTTFELTRYSVPLQLVHCEPLGAMNTVDLAEDDEGGIDALLRHELSRPFDLRSGPLVRFGAAADPSSSAHRSGFWLLLSEFHGVMDGWSRHVVLGEVCARYEALLADPDAACRPPPSPAQAMLVELELDALEQPEHLEYFRSLLRDAKTPALPRRTDAIGPRHADRRRVAEVGDALSDLRQTAARIEVPLKSLLLATHVCVVAESLGTDDVVTGLVVSCRPPALDGDEAVGLFINTVPLRVTVDGHSWATLATALHAAEVELLPHRWLPVAAIARETGAMPFEWFFNYTDFRSAPSAAPSAALRPGVERGYPVDVDFPLSVDYEVDSSGALDVYLQFDSADLDPDFVASTAARYADAIAAAVADPLAPVNTSPVRGSGDDAALQIVLDALATTVAVAGDRTFAALGGTSLDATRVVARLREQLGLHVPLCDVLGETSIVELVRRWTAAPRSEVRR